MTTLEYEGWKYIYKGGQFKVESSIEDKKISPKSLFKYYGVSKYSVDAFLKRYLYAAHPDELNDLYDFNSDLLGFTGSEEEIDFLYQFLRKNGLNREKREFREDISSGKSLSYIQIFKKLFKEKLSERLGVISLSNNPESIPMWSYYAQNKGFMLEFDTSELNLQGVPYGPFPVHYPVTHKQIHFSDVKRESLNEIKLYALFLAMITTKTKDWKHEDEWRYLVEGEKDKKSLFYEDGDKVISGRSRCFGYNVHAIKSITFGARFFKDITKDTDTRVVFTTRDSQTQKIVNDALKSGFKLFIIREGIIVFKLHRVPLTLTPMESEPSIYIAEF
ncbi:MAG: DUF2971 domain-containing protein [Salibacteraceae bacterium]